MQVFFYSRGYKNNAQGIPFILLLCLTFQLKIILMLRHK